MASTEAAPPGVDLSDDARGEIIVGISVCMGFSFVAFVMRLASRRLNHIPLVASDYLAICGFLCSWVVSLVVINEARLGLGLHVERVSPANVREILLTDFVGQIFYAIGFVVIKVSILLLYRHLFASSRFIATSTLAVGVFVVLWGVAVLLVIIFGCQPINGFWDVGVPSRCVDAKLFFVGGAVPNLVADVLLLALPMRDIWSLHLDIQAKLGVSAVFALGAFTAVASGVRLHFLLPMNESDITWSYVGVGLWSAIEIDVAFISTCLPTVRPVLALLMPCWRGRGRPNLTGSRSGRSLGSTAHPESASSPLSTAKNFSRPGRWGAFSPRIIIKTEDDFHRLQDLTPAQSRGKEESRLGIVEQPARPAQKGRVEREEVDRGEPGWL